MIEIQKINTDRKLDDLEYYVNLLDNNDKTAWLSDPLVKKLNDFAGYPVYKFKWEDEKDVYVITNKQSNKFIGAVVLSKYHTGYQSEFVGFRSEVKGNKLGSRFYRYLISMHNLIIISGVHQTTSGQRLWKDLFNYDDIFVYAYDFNIDKIYEVSSDFDRLLSTVSLYSDSSSNVRLVAYSKLLESLALNTESLTETMTNHIMPKMNTSINVNRKVTRLGQIKEYTKLEMAIMEGGHVLEDDNVIDMSKFRKPLNADDLLNKIKEKGILDSLPVGLRIEYNSRIYKVIGHTLLKVGTVSSDPNNKLFINSKLLFNDAKFYYTVGVILLQTSGDEENTRFVIRLEKLIDTETKQNRFKEFGIKNTTLHEHIHKKIGYKIMNYNPKNNTITSLYNKDIKFNLGKNKILSMNNSEIYLSTNKNFVINHYSRLTDEVEILLTLEYLPGDIITGNDTDNENEFTVRKAKIIDYEILPKLNENMSFTAYEKSKKATKQGIVPGTEKWFDHWFSLPYMINKRRTRKKPSD